MATFPAKTSYNNGDTYYNSDVNDYGDLINRLYGDIAVANVASSGIVANKGDILTGSAANTLIKTAIGTNNFVLRADSAGSGGVSWGLITTSNISGSAGITGSQIASTTIAAGNIVANTITSTQVDQTTVYVRGTTTLANASAKIHYGTSAPASGTGGIGDIFFQY